MQAKHTHKPCTMLIPGGQIRWNRPAAASEGWEQQLLRGWLGTLGPSRRGVQGPVCTYVCIRMCVLMYVHIAYASICVCAHECVYRPACVGQPARVRRMRLCVCMY